MGEGYLENGKRVVIKHPREIPTGMEVIIDGGDPIPVDQGVKPLTVGNTYVLEYQDGVFRPVAFGNLVVEDIQEKLMFSEKKGSLGSCNSKSTSPTSWNVAPPFRPSAILKVFPRSNV